MTHGSIFSECERSALKRHADPTLVVSRSRRGRPPSVSQQVITAAIAVAEERDLRKDSCTSNADVMSVVNNLRREALAESGLNPHVTLPVLSRSTCSRTVKQVAGVIVKNGSIQNPSRQRALRDSTLR